jgi:hypothetical protein
VPVRRDRPDGRGPGRHHPLMIPDHGHHGTGRFPGLSAGSLRPSCSSRCPRRPGC